MTKNIAILGSTGSIGTQTLDVARMHNIKVSALTANKNIDILEQQIREFKPHLVCITEEEYASRLKAAVSDVNVKITSGISGMKEAAQLENVDTVVNAVVGAAGLLPTMYAIEAKKNIALANKETLVAGGGVVTEAVKRHNVTLYPVDSEHSAIFQCLQGCSANSLKKIILTASGGAFFGKTKNDLKNVTVEQALQHPNWNMGAKITIDSATMMNKGLEVIEASWLFNMPEDQIDVLIHRESIIHSMIQLKDNAVIAQLGTADMRIPIQYALTYPQRLPSPVKELDLSDIAKLTFAKPDNDTFQCLDICRKALRKGGLYPAVANAANEAAVELFLKQKISFGDISEIVGNTVEKFRGSEQECSLEAILSTDMEIRKQILNQ